MIYFIYDRQVFYHQAETSAFFIIFMLKQHLATLPRLALSSLCNPVVKADLEIVMVLPQLPK